jgi:amino acid adenylation domain-containing protein
MTLPEVLAYLQAEKVDVTVQRGELLIRARRGVIGPELIPLLKRYKRELLVTFSNCKSSFSENVAQEASPLITITPEMLPLVNLTQGEIDQIVVTMAGGAANVQDIYPLAPSQEGILFHHVLDNAGDTYLVRTILAFDSRSRLDAFLRALQTVIDRHDLLRSGVYWQGLSQPVQVVHREARLPVEELTLARDEDALGNLRSRTDPRHLRLDLQRAPLLAAYVTQEPNSGEWLLSLLMHHLVSDHVTLELMLSEIQLLLGGKSEYLPEPLPYRNFIAQGHRMAPEEDEKFFREQLSDVDEPTAPFGILNVQGDGSSRLEEARLKLNNYLAPRIRSAARELGVTPAVLFHVAWAQVLAKCSGRDDVVFGTVLSGRLQGSEGADRVLGMFINTLPIRISLSTLGVREVARDVYQRLSEMLEHEQASLALAQRCSGVAPPLPLFTSLLNYRHSHAASTVEDSPVLPGWEGMRLVSAEERTNYPLAVSVDDLGEGFALTAQCAGGIDATRIVNYLEKTIEGLVEALGTVPQQPAYRLNILPESERQQLLVEFNDTKADYATDGLIHQLFEEQTARASEATALVFEEERLSYGELNRRANQVAHCLIGLGIRPDDRVAICMERSLEMVVGLLGILKAGGAYVPLDPSYPEERLAYMLEDSAPVALLTQSPLRGRFAKFTSQLLVVDEADGLSLLARQPQDNPDPTLLGLGGNHLAYVIYTSGSTGLPKGVMNEHGGLCNLALAQVELFGVGPESRVLQFASLSFDASISEIMMALCSGATLHLGSREELRPGKPLLSTLQGRQITHVTLPASVLQAWAEEELPNGLLTVVAAGEALPRAVAWRWASRHRLFNAYGPTEATVCATTYRCEAERDGAIPIGRPIANTQIYILDQHLEPVPMGVSGEIYIGGVGVARGYLNRPELTAERFIANPFSRDPAERLYKSGDLGRWLPDGNIEYLGRNDFQVKIRGFRIELVEIEARLLECEGVREAVVIAREDKPGEKRLVAYVVMQGGVELSAASLREELSKVLADYMVPSAFVSLEALPLTPNGKLDRRALPAPDQSAVITRGYEAPVGELEVTLAEIWQELLGLERVGRHDHFFELGGHSLLAVQVVSRLRQRLRVEVALRELFAQPTLGEFAKIVAQAGHGAQPPLLPADRTEPLPLSWAQQRLWFLDQLDQAASAAYHIPAALRLSGKLNQWALQAALDRIVARHESLRTTFVSVEGTPTQVIARAEIGFALRHQDLSSLEGSAQEAAVTELAVAEGSQSFDLTTGPLIRGQLLRLADDEHVLLVTQHHIISDGWSIGVLVRELSALYSAFSQEEPDPLPELTIQYADYAVWQRQWLAGEVLQKQVDYWREHLGGAPALLELPTDRPRPGGQSYKGSSMPMTLSPELTARLRALSQRHGTTLFMTLLGAWSALLSRLSGQTDVVIGTPVANRQRSEIEPLIGFFVNTLALRIRLEEDPSVAQLLEQIKGTTLGAYAHQDLPFEQVVEALQPDRSLSYSPLFQAMLVLNNLPNAGTLTLPGLRLAPIEIPRATTQFGLTLSLNEAGESMVGSLEYSTDLFDANTVERMMGHFVTLLRAMVEDQSQRISQLPLLSTAQRHQLLVEFNGAKTEYPSGRLIHELFEEQAARVPEATALVFGEERLTYGELNRRANQVAHHLIRLGLHPDDLVAICVERSLEMVIGTLAILKAGGAYVPLDPTYPKERLAYMLEDSAPRVLLTQARLRHTLPKVESHVVLLDQDPPPSEPAQHPNHNPDPVALGLTSAHLAYVIYTSGSTGLPKGAMNIHRGIVNRLAWMQREYRLGSTERVLHKTPLSFDVSVWEIFWTLSAGATLIIAAPGGHRDPAYLAELLDREKVNVTAFVPSVLRSLISDGALSVLPHLRVLFSGGEALPTSLAADFMQRFPRTSLVNLYGPTETSIGVTYWPAEPREGTGVAPIGRPISNVQVYILDTEQQLVPMGVSGELHIGGVAVGRGYHGQPELTTEKFISDPFSTDPEARLYKTGDLARWLPDGNIEYLGRNDFQVKIRGFRIELGEIEAQLVACSGVREAVVIAREDNPGKKFLVAYVVSQEGAELSATTLREKLSEVLAEYMVPSAFVSLEALPLTPNGKLDRRALPPPDQSAMSTRGYEVPLGEIEIAIGEIWQELLGLDQVGRHDHFFELGGHSLLAVQVVSRLRQRLGVEVALRELFAQPTLREFGKIVGQAGHGAQPPLARADRSEPLPLSWAQQRLWFLDRLDDAAGAAYHIPAAVRLSGKLHQDALQAAFDRIVARHETLRTTFVSVEGRPIQVIAATGIGFALVEHDLRNLDASEQRAAITELSRAEMSAPFDLATGPLIRGRLLLLGRDDHILLLTQHHIISDGWSIGVLVRELSALYRAFSQGESDPLPELDIQYADYAVWQREWLAGEVLQKQIDFWREHLTGAPSLLELPTDRPRPAEQSYKGNSIPVTLPAKLTAGLRALSQRHGTTLFMTLLGGWSGLLSRLSGRTDVVIGTPVANRQQSEIESLIGFFVNTLALRVRLEEDPSVAQLLKQIKATTLGAYAHQDLPFEQVVEALQPVRSLSHSPLFQTMLALDNTPRGAESILPGLRMAPIAMPHNTTHFDLALSLSEAGQTEEGMVGLLEYATDLFDASTVERMAECFVSLLSGMVKDQSQRISELPLLSVMQRHHLLVELNSTETHYPSDKLIHQLFEEQVSLRPEAIALVGEEEQLSYAELNRRANQLAHALIALGVCADERVATCMERGPEMVVALLGIWKAGGVYVPLDPAYPQDRMAYMLDDSAPVALITQAALQDSLTLLGSPAREIPVLRLDKDDDESALARHSGLNPDPRTLGLTSRHLGYVIYTSGSTGSPKGVMNHHRGMCNLVTAQVPVFAIGPNSQMLQFASCSFDASIWEVILALCSGACLHTTDPASLLPGQPLLTTFRARRITHAVLPPSALSALSPHADLGTVHTLILGGEALPSRLAHDWAGRYRLFNAYGPSEATVCTTTYYCKPDHAGVVPIGRPIANTQIYILDSRLQAVPLGVCGEIHIGGAGVARGYLNRPELTVERFIVDPFRTDPEAQLYKTGDLGRWLPDGNIEYLGRNDFQVKIRGFRIEPGEIEARLLECEGVREAVVIAREDNPGEKRLVAYVVPQEGMELFAATLREELSKVLADYMVPSAFVSLKALPLTCNGKLDRHALPAPDQNAVITRGYEAPMGEIEEAIADVWRELLSLERVGRNDHFFELGGHSLLAVQVISRLRDVLKIEVALRELFLQPTLAAFAQVTAVACRSAQPPLLPADRREPLPLSWAQRRLWFLDRLDDAAGAAYHIPAVLRLSGNLNQGALQAALDRIVARHESLRTTFVSLEGTPTQVIAPAETGFALRQRDLSSLKGSAQEAAVTGLAIAEGSQSFDLTTGPLIRGQLLRLTDDEHVLLVTQHHIISDGWSIGVLVRELSALYSAFSQGEPDPFPPLTIQYADYAVWQRQWLAGDVLKKQIDFWREHLAGAPALLELPTDRARPGEQSYKGSSIPVTLPAQLTAGLRALSQRHGTTLFMTLLGGWSVLLSRLSGQKEVVIGTPVANRQRSEIEPLIGFFVNTLALRVRLEEDPSVAQLLEQIKATTLGAYAHQDLPFEQVVEALQPERSLSHSALFQAMLVLNNLPSEGELTLQGLRLTPMEMPQTATQFDLTLSLNEASESIVGGLEYATDLFDASTVERMMGYFVTLLHGMVFDETQRISQLPLLSETQRHQLLFEFNATETGYQSDRLIHELFEEHAARSPEATALVYGEVSLSYRELNRRANQLAHRLISLGIRPDDRVAICVERSLEMVIGLLGILKAGGAYLPLDPSYPKERLANIFEASLPFALLTQKRLWQSFSDVQSHLLLLDDADDLWLLGAQPENNPDATTLGLTPRHLAYVIYTSGSTGTPKGVMVEHRQLVASNGARLFRYLTGERFLLVPSFAFDSSVAVIFWSLTTGAALVLTQETQARDAAALAELVRNNHVDVWLSVPSLYDATLVSAGAHALASLRTAIVAGEELNQAVWHRHAQKMGTEVRLYNEYGPTETCVWSTCDEAFPQRSFPGGRIGRPIANTQIYILDARREPVPIGTVGEIYIGGQGVARGYLNQPDLTAERFIPDPFRTSSGAPLYKTGDLGRWLPDGNIEYLGRNDFQVKIRGFRIELGEIEARLTTCGGVGEGVVMAREDNPGEKRLVAYVVPQEGMELSAATLREELSKVLAEYMVPSAFVSLNALPLTPNGKLDRRALPAPDQSAVATRAYKAPTGEVESLIAATWQELLGLAKVGRNDHFFELGGHSLMVITMIERLRERGVNADVRTVFVSPTLSALAAAIAEGKGAVPVMEVPPNPITFDCTAITPEMLPLVDLTQGEIEQIVAHVPGGVGNIQDIYPLAPLQEGILFHHLLETKGDAYLQRTILAFASRDRLDSFLGALQIVIERHDLLRSAFYWEGLSQPVQVVYRQAQLPVEALTLAAKGEALAQLRAATDPRHLRLDLHRAPLLKGYVAEEPHSGEWLLSLLVHHMVSDHVAQELILSEIQLLLLGQKQRLPRTLPYRNFIAQAHRVTPEEHESYFRRQLAEVDEPTAPFRGLNVQGDGSQVEEARLSLGDHLAERIRAAAREQGVTPAVLFHLAWAQVLGRCSGRDDVVFGTVLSGRLQGVEGADRVMGMFINTLPIRLPLARVGVRDAVHDTYDRLRELLEHEQASLALAQRCSGVAPPLPLFTSLFNYRHSQGPSTQTGNIADEIAWEGIRLLDGEERTNYPLAVSVDDSGEGFVVTAQCGEGINATRIVNYLGTAIEGLLEALVTAPEQPAYRLNILPESERRQLLVEFNATEAEYPSDKLIHWLFEEQAALRPEAIALRCEGEQLSYGELNRRANQVAHYLIGLGISADDRVTICLERSLEMVVGLLGILKAGGAYVPLDPSYPEERLAYMLEDSAPVALLTQSSLRNQWPKFTRPILLLDGADDLALLARQPQGNPDPLALGLSARQLAYVIYTSGSTGAPKGVMIEHRSVVNLWSELERVVFGGQSGQTRVGLNAALSFDASIQSVTQLLSGRCVVIIPQHVRADGAALRRFLAEHEVDVFDCTPGQLELMLEDGLLDGAGYQPKSILVGGEAIGAKTWERLSRSSSTKFYNVYGPTECTVDATIAVVEASAGPPHIGRPVANTQIYILDGHLEPVPLGVCGEIYIGGVGIARGYLNRPELTTERFISDPFSTDPTARLYKTGDLGRWLAEGNIEYLGRNDCQVKIRGFRIEPGEIEARLLECEGVREAVVIARDDSNGQKRLVAYLRADEGIELSPGDLRSQVACSLPDYMAPSAFVSLEKLPLTPNGKLDRGALPEPNQSAVTMRGYEAPIGEVEVAVAKIWQDLLSLERVGRNDHFFELGGHSLLAVQSMVRIQEKFGIDIPLRDLFEKPLLSSVAELVVSVQLECFLDSDIADMEKELDALTETELRAILMNGVMDQSK